MTRRPSKSNLEILKSKIPRNFKLIPLSKLKLDIGPNVAVMGKVAKRNLQYNNSFRSWIKVDLVSADSTPMEEDRTLFVYFFDAKISLAISLNLGDLVALAGFEVEEVPSVKDGADAASKKLFQFQLVLGSPCSQVWTTKAEKKKDYTYVTLREIIDHPNCHTERFNCYGVVSGCQRKTALDSRLGYLELSVSDPSTHKMEVAVYQRNQEDHIPPELTKDCVVRFHRLKLHFFPNGRILGKVFSPRDCLIFTKDSLQPVSTARSFTFTDQDRTKAESLMDWYKKNYSPFKSLKDLSIGEFADVICQVVRVTVLTAGQCVVLQVWDGTKPLCGNYHYQAPFWERQECSDSLVEAAQGYLCDIWAYDEHALTAAQLHPEDVVVFHNLHQKQFSLTKNCRLYMHRGTSFSRNIQVLPSTSPDAANLLQKLSLKKLRNALSHQQPHFEPQPPNSSHALSAVMHTPALSLHVDTTAPHSDDTPEPSDNSYSQLPVVIELCEGPSLLTISKRVGSCTHGLMAEPGANPPFYSHRTVRVLSSHSLNPFDALWWHCAMCQFLVPYRGYNGHGLCPHCSPSCYQLDLTLLVIIHLADGSDVYQALLWGPHAEAFFRGISPNTVLREPHQLAAMLSRLTDGHPRLECCLLFYTSAVSSTLRIQIRNTILT